MGGVLIRRRTQDKRREHLEMVKLHNEVDKFGMPKFALEREQRIDIERGKIKFKNSGKIGV